MAHLSSCALLILLAIYSWALECLECTSLKSISTYPFDLLSAGLTVLVRVTSSPDLPLFLLLQSHHFPHVISDGVA